jgi:2-amino-4-hydroxy-6-hydroxymethyldihydropteridine diphosphokinase
MTPGYILGLGTNLDPEANVPRLVKQLVRRFGLILISRLYDTAPVGMDSERRFVNFCAFAQTGLEPDACKTACVGIEVAMGRDRTHPFRKTRDRPADIDLLAHVDAGGRRVQLEPVADYLAQPMVEIVALLLPGRPVPAARGRVRTFAVGEVLLGEAPAAVDRDDRTGLIVVGQNRLHG